MFFLVKTGNIAEIDINYLLLPAKSCIIFLFLENFSWNPKDAQKGLNRLFLA